MARMKDELYDEGYNGYMHTPNLSLRYKPSNYKLGLDTPEFEFESLLSMLAYPGISDQYAAQILKEIDELSEKEMSKQAHAAAEKKTAAMIMQTYGETFPELVKYTDEKIYEEEYASKLSDSLETPELHNFTRMEKFIIVSIVLATAFIASWASAFEPTIWCRVTDYNTQCIYFNLQACQIDASINGGICVPKPSN